MTLNEMAKQAHRCSLEHGWWDAQRSVLRASDGSPVLVGSLDPAAVLATVPEKLALIHSEVSEALEDYRVGNMGVSCTTMGKPEGFPSELADIIIRVMDLSEALGIDLGSAVQQKMDYNESRPYRHGGKVC